MKLYYNPLSTYSQKTMIALYEKGIEFEPNIVNLMDPDSQAEYREIYPMGKIPLLQLDDDHIIPESSIIIEYLDGVGGAKLIAGDADTSRRVRFKDRMFDLYLNESVVTLLFQNMKQEATRDDERIDTAKSRIDVMYGFMEQEFGNQSYANGEAFQMSDCAAAGAMFYAQQVAPFDKLDNICAYWDRLQSRPSVRRVHEEAAPYVAEFMKANT